MSHQEMSMGTPSNVCTYKNRFFLADFVSIQRNSFLNFLEKGLIEEFAKLRSSAPITNRSKTLEVFFYPEYYQLTRPKYSLRQAILKGKSYSSRLYIPVQLTDKKSRIIQFKWVYIADLPIMTKRGHFIINGAARVIVNQIIRSPGIYYQTKIYENYSTKWAQKPESFYERHYADLICQRGTWLRLEIDRDKKIWAQTKKGPKIPILWFLIAMGLTEKMIFKSVMDPNRLLYNMLEDPTDPTKKGNSGQRPQVLNISAMGDYNIDLSQVDGTKAAEQLYSHKIPKYIATPPEAWAAIYSLFNKKKSKTNSKKNLKQNNTVDVSDNTELSISDSAPEVQNRKSKRNPKSKSASSTLSSSKAVGGAKLGQRSFEADLQINTLSELGRQLMFNKFMNPRTYDLSKQGRLNFNKKFNLSVSPYQTTLTPQDILAATDHLLKVEYGFKKVDDIDHLKNRRVRTSGELIQIQLGIGLVRLEKTIREKIKNIDYLPSPNLSSNQVITSKKTVASLPKLENQSGLKTPNLEATLVYDQRSFLKKDGIKESMSNATVNNSGLRPQKSPILAKAKIEKSWTYHRGSKINPKVSINSLINTKAVNSVLREFFGTSPLSQFMDQINPLAELTHKRRLSSMGPGGVTRDSATLDIRGIHPSHYGRICPVETPEGKNTGLVNSLTTYARVNEQGFIETPFYKVYKGQVQKKLGMFYFAAEHEAKIKLGAADLFTSDIGFLSKAKIPVRIEEEFSKISRNVVEYVGVSPTQMVSIATSLIPFLEHDDANRALMGSNMQRQAVPLLKPERPIVGTGLEARAVSDSGHALQVKTSGLVTYVSADKIILYTETN
jgi:DNA-directed RNA polymerase beta subunit